MRVGEHPYISARHLQLMAFYSHDDRALTAVFAPSTYTQLFNAVDDWYQNDTQSYGHINTWDVSQITTMNQLFKDYEHFNDDISAWDVSSVTNMDEMFFGTRSFNQPIDVWDVSGVISMHNMFAYNSGTYCHYLCWDLSDDVVKNTYTNNGSIGVDITLGPLYSSYTSPGANCECAEGQTLNAHFGNRGRCEGNASTSFIAPEKQCEMMEHDVQALTVHLSVIISCLLVALVAFIVYRALQCCGHKQKKKGWEGDTSNKPPSCVTQWATRVSSWWTPLVALCFYQALAISDVVTDTMVYVSLFSPDQSPLPCDFGGLGTMISCYVEEDNFNRDTEFGDGCGRCRDVNEFGPEKHFDAVCYIDDVASSETSGSGEGEFLRNIFDKSCMSNAVVHHMIVTAKTSIVSIILSNLCMTLHASQATP